MDDPNEDRLIDLAELSHRLKRKCKTIYNQLSAAPETLPPRFVVPGTRGLRWRLKDVVAWMQKHSPDPS